MNDLAMTLLAISSREFLPDEAELINGLFREGLSCLHLRKPDSSEIDFKNLILKINPTFHDRISVHQHHEITKELGIKRLHFTESQRESISHEMLKSLTEQGFTLSTSIHTMTTLDSLSMDFNYTFLGPVFDSISKSGYRSALTDDFLLTKTQKKIQVIALGGIDITNIDKVKKMNFDGAALLGTLWVNPEKSLEKFIEIRAKYDR